MNRLQCVLSCFYVSLSLIFVGCSQQPQSAVSNDTPPRSAAIITSPTTIASGSSDTAPKLGLITIGAFAPESVPYDNMSIEGLAAGDNYEIYREAVSNYYGAPLADMNYLGVGIPDWQARLPCVHAWLTRASAYGDPTLAIEPVGPTGYEIFSNNPEMTELKKVFTEEQEAGVTVWVRFASESNLSNSSYSVYDNPHGIALYRKSVRWFKSYMPSNVKLVFSPLINTAYLKAPTQLRTLIAMYDPGAYDRIGGTLYATSWLRPKYAFDWYYHFMRKLDSKTPFEICELGGIYPRSEEVRAFLIRVAKGQWPGVQRVNLFAGDLNPLAVSEHGHFGFIMPGTSTCFVRDLLTNTSGGAASVSQYSEADLNHMEALGAGWQSQEMSLVGSVVSLPDRLCEFKMSITEVLDNTGVSATLSPPRRKDVVVASECIGGILASQLRVGEMLQISGWDAGPGTPLRATQITPMYQ